MICISRHILIAVSALTLAFWALPAIASADEMLIVIGAPGTPEYAADFTETAEAWQRLAKLNDVTCTTIGLGPLADEDADREMLQESLKNLAASPEEASPLWVVLIGHGTFAEGVAKFNVRGTDFSATELADWLLPKNRLTIIINNASSSGPFVNRLSGEGRIVVTATKSGSEQNYARFGKYFSAAMSSLDADLDHDDEVSIREAFTLATRGVEEFYSSEGRISTEHALLDDNGDKTGTPAKILLGAKTAKGSLAKDGEMAAKISLSPTGEKKKLSPAQSQRRDKLESQLETLRKSAAGKPEAEYQAEILPIMLELARLYFPESERSLNDNQSSNE